MWLDWLIFGGAGLLLFCCVMWVVIQDLKDEQAAEESYYERMRGKHSRGS